MINRKYIKNKSHVKVNLTLRIIVLIILISAILLKIFVSPIILRCMEYQGKMIINNILAQTINDILADDDIAYENIVIIKRDKDDKISSIQTDIKTINTIKSRLTSDVGNVFKDVSTKDYYLPLGTLLGNTFVVGRGPDIKLSVVPMGYLNSEIISEFSSAGINQTNYKVMLNVALNYTTIIPLHKKTTKLETNFVVVDTIIVGEIPEYYTNIKSDNGSLIPNPGIIYPPTTAK